MEQSAEDIINAFKQVLNEKSDLELLVHGIRVQNRTVVYGKELTMRGRPVNRASTFVLELTSFDNQSEIPF